MEITACQKWGSRVETQRFKVWVTSREREYTKKKSGNGSIKTFQKFDVSHMKRIFQQPKQMRRHLSSFTIF
jgi:hypothetical protein